eukprot:2561435-Pleurochrysis_carterae.AAC.1
MADHMHRATGFKRNGTRNFRSLAKGRFATLFALTAHVARSQERRRQRSRWRRCWRCRLSGPRLSDAAWRSCAGAARQRRLRRDRNNWRANGRARRLRVASRHRTDALSTSRTLGDLCPD